MVCIPQPGHVRAGRTENLMAEPDLDFYAILGVLPTAEDVVIRAAYRALAQRYHQDRAGDTTNGMHQRMVEINAAYEVLSDRHKREEYDRRRKGQTPSSSSYFGDGNESPPPFDPLAKDWGVAVQYHPDLPALEAELNEFS